MSYEIRESTSNGRSHLLNDGEPFATRNEADAYMLSILWAPKLKISDYIWDEDEDNEGCADIAAIQGMKIRTFAINSI